MIELEQWHSSSRYLDATAADTSRCSTLQQSERRVETLTDVCVDSEGSQADAIASLSTQDGHAANLEESSATCFPAFDSSRMTFDSECRDCQLPYVNPDNLDMYLHAHCYQVRFLWYKSCKLTFCLLL